jgi:hypothetical protein
MQDFTSGREDPAMGSGLQVVRGLGPSAARIERSWGGFSPRRGRRSPIRVLTGVQPAETQPGHPREVAAG